MVIVTVISSSQHKSKQYTIQLAKSVPGARFRMSQRGGRDPDRRAASLH